MSGNGLRQIAPTLDGIAPDHRKRYEFAPVEGLTVIDAACGCGYGSFIMGEKAAKVVAIDSDHTACMYGMGHYARPNIVYVTGNVTAPSFKSLGEFDAVVSFETIEHVENPEALLKVFASMAPRLIASVPNENVIAFSKQKFPYHYRHYTPEQFEELLNSAGWKIVEKYTQMDKWQGDIIEGENGRTLIVVAELNKEESES